jgi:hypothetical protein
MENIMSDEIWRPIVIDNVNDYYEVSNHGNVRSRNMETGNMSQRMDNGYLVVNLTKKQKKTKNDDYAMRVHRLVAIHFIENPENKPTVDHIDRNRSNNHVSNLRWASYSEQNANQELGKRENIADRKRVQQLDPGTKNVVTVFESQTAAAKAIGKGKDRISKACYNPNLLVGGYYWKFETNNGVTGGLEAAGAPGATVQTTTEDMLDLLEDLTNDVEEVTLEDQPRQEPIVPQVVTEPEEWRRVVLPDGTTVNTHMISNKGFIRSNDKENILRQGQKDKTGYRFKFTIDGILKSYGVHDLVACTFIRLPEDGEVIWHKNRERTDNRSGNLEWISQSTRQQTKIKKTSQAQRIRAIFPDGTVKIYDSQGDASRDTGDKQISNFIHGKSKKTKSGIKYEFVQE